MRQIVVATILTVAFALVGAERVWACACNVVVPFAEAAKTAPILLVGSVRAVAPPDDRTAFHGRNTAVFIDLDVIRVIGGMSSHKTQVRIWDSMYGSTCEGAFRDLKPGMLVLVIAQKNHAPKQFRDEVWSLTGVKPRAGDLLAGPPCAEILRTLSAPQ